MNYYNEHDPKAAEWLRELIRQGHIPAGEVDTRCIRDVCANDLVRFTQCHFFAGIGGWSLALRLAGWPDDEPVWTGSCPCQPFSAAGKQMGTADSRHLWPAFRRLILHGAPAVVFGEQVASALGREWLAGIRANLETMGYVVGSADLCAAGVGAPHIRQRLFWVGDSIGNGAVRARRPERQLNAASANGHWLGNAEGGRDGAASVAGIHCEIAGERRERFAGGSGASDGLVFANGSGRESGFAATEKRGALNPAHSRWLMGFPAAWDSCGATAMQSCRKSPRNSSKPTSKPKES